MAADYSIRVLQSRKKLIAAAPVKDPATGNMRTKVFTVEARAAFIEATTADYAVAYGLAGQLLRETLSDVKAPLRDVFQRIQDLAGAAICAATCSPRRLPKG